jgi:lysophospholipase L1-like esterase
MRHRLTPALVLALLLGASSLARAQARFDVYVALGDSLTAGFSSGSLVETHQRNSYPALIARVAGTQSFQQPTVSEPGIPPELELVRLSPSVVVLPKASSPGAPTNLSLPQPYNNLGVPGADLQDLLSTVTDGGGFHDLVLRKQGTALQEAAALHPTFVTLWIGNNDALGAVTQGRAIEGETLTPVAKFRSRYESIIAALQSTGASVVAANLPDATSIPFVTTIPPVVTDPTTQQPLLVGGQPVPLIGPTGSLASNAYVLLSASSLLAQGIGVPKSVGGQGVPLPDQVILDADEAGAIRDHINGYNLAISDICGQAGIPVLDVNALYRDIAAHGRDIGGVHLSAAYLTGGIFSYDGIHPTDLGYAILANEWIQRINDASGAGLPLVDLGPYLGVTQTSRRATPPAELSSEAYRNLLMVFPPVDRR